MVTFSSLQPWSQRLLNRSGIRRLKIADANSLVLLPFGGIIPQSSFVFYEFIFPADLSCVASVNQQAKESGSVFWNQAVNFSLPHISDSVVNWTVENGNTLWIAIAEDYNGECRAFGGVPEGLKMNFEATTGNSPKAANPMNFSFSGEQILPYTILPAYEDSILFPSGGFSYGFSISFNS